MKIEIAYRSNAYKSAFAFEISPDGMGLFGLFILSIWTAVKPLKVKKPANNAVKDIAAQNVVEFTRPPLVVSPKIIAANATGM